MALEERGTKHNTSVHHAYHCTMYTNVTNVHTPLAPMYSVHHTMTCTPKVAAGMHLARRGVGGAWLPCQPFTKFQILTNREDTNFTNEYTKRNRQLRMQVFCKTLVSGFHWFGNRKFPQGFHWFGNRKFPEDMSSVPRLESLTFQRELQSPHSDNFSQIHQKYAFQKSQEQPTIWTS